MCRTNFDRTEFLHRILPALPAGAVAAQVEVTHTATARDPAVEARVVSMIRGAYQGRRIRLTPLHPNDCDVLPSLGDRGIVAGRVLAISRDMLVIDRIRTPSAIERRRRGERPLGNDE